MKITVGDTFNIPLFAYSKSKSLIEGGENKFYRIYNDGKNFKIIKSGEYQKPHLVRVINNEVAYYDHVMKKTLKFKSSELLNVFKKQLENTFNCGSLNLELNYIKEIVLRLENIKIEDLFSSAPQNNLYLQFNYDFFLGQSPLSFKVFNSSLELLPINQNFKLLINK